MESYGSRPEAHGCTLIWCYDNHALAEHGTAVVGLEAFKRRLAAIVDTGDSGSVDAEEYLIVGIGTYISVLVDDLSIDEYEMLAANFAAVGHRPVDAFVKANDFTGKHVVTFATAYSSPLGNSGKLLSEMAGGKGQWQDGICFTGSLSEDKVREWVRSLE